MPRPSFIHLSIAAAAFALFAVGIAAGLLFAGGGTSAERPASPSSDAVTAPVGRTTDLKVADGDLQVAVVRLTTSPTATVHVPAKGAPPLRAEAGEQLARADLELMVGGSAPRPSLCALSKPGKASRIAGAILVDDTGDKHAPLPASATVSLTPPCESLPPRLAASVSLVFAIPADVAPDLLLLFDPRERGDEKGLTRMRFPAAHDDA